MLAWPAAALADGDPASDILVSEDVYYGYGIDLEAKAAAQLPALLADARGRGFPVKVALISGFVDLGVATWMWLDPREYARYLAVELGLVYQGRVLVLMRNGYGLFLDGRVPGKDRRVIAGLAPPRRAARFLASAIVAVRELAAANGVRLKVRDVEPPPGGIVQGPPEHAALPPAGEPPTRVTPTPTARPAERATSPAWPFLVPVGLLVVAVGIARSRRGPAA